MFVNLFERVSLVLRAVAGQTAHTIARAGLSPAKPEERVEDLLEQAEQRLKRLNALLAEAVAREQRAELDWRDAVARAGALAIEVDATVAGRQDETARAQAKALAAERAYRDYAAATEKLRIQIQDTQAQLNAARKQSGQRVGDPAPAPGTRAAQHRQSQQHHVTTQGGLDAHTDTTDAKDALDQTRIADLLTQRAKKEG